MDGIAFLSSFLWVGYGPPSGQWLRPKRESEDKKKAIPIQFNSSAGKASERSGGKPNQFIKLMKLIVN